MRGATAKAIQELAGQQTDVLAGNLVEGIHSPVEIVECDPAVEPFAVQWNTARSFTVA
jgi:hypothetical protein